MTALPGQSIHIDAHYGSDKIHAANGAGDEIFGGPDIDEAWLNAGDEINSVEKCHPGPCTRYGRATRGRGRYPRAVGLASALSYPVYEAIIECVRDPARIWLPNEMTLRAVDATKGTDWQTVAIEPVLSKLEGSEWVEIRNGVWLWDRVTDKLDTLTVFYGTSWKSFRDKQRKYISWDVPGPGTYEVSFRAYWYAIGGVPEHEVLYHGGPHYSEEGLAEPTYSSCVYP